MLFEIVIGGSDLHSWTLDTRGCSGISRALRAADAVELKPHELSHPRSFNVLHVVDILFASCPFVLCHPDCITVHWAFAGLQYE